jgi:hypothetical protein
MNGNLSRYRTRRGGAARESFGLFEESKNLLFLKKKKQKDFFYFAELSGGHVARRK